MDYEKAYKDALKRAKKLYEQGTITESLSYVFPELAESEDERIREAQLDYWRSVGGKEWHGVPVQEAIAWLEKHKPVEHLELKAGHWYICYRAYCCRADSLTVREGERFMCEKDGVVKGFVIKDAEKYFKECNAPAPYEDEQDTTQFKYNGSDDVRRQSTIQVLEYARSLDTYNQYGKADIDKNIAWLEKQGEQNFPILSNSAKTGKNWSEEDEKCIDNCCLLIGAADNCYKKTFKDDCIHYLQNLKKRMEV